MLIITSEFTPKSSPFSSYVHLSNPSSSTVSLLYRNHSSIQDILGSTSSDLFSAFLSSASAISSGWLLYLDTYLDYGRRAPKFKDQIDSFRCNSPLAVGDLPFSVPAQPSTVSSSEKQLQLPLPYPLSSMTLRYVKIVIQFLNSTHPIPR